MADLFDDLDRGNKAVKILPKGAKALTKSQIDFNKIILKTQNLEKQLLSEQKKMEKMLNYYNANIEPANKKTAQVKLDGAVLLNRIFKENKFAGKTKAMIQECIIALMYEAFEHLLPSKEEEEVYNSWSNISYKKEREEQIKEEKSMFSDMMNDLYGIDLEMDKWDLEDEASFAAFKAKMEEKLKAKMSEDDSKGRGKKSKKQIENESLLKAEEELKSKNVRSIYIALTKILHPDLELDPERKLEKERIMKEVTVAYEEKDLSKLLKLEIEWVYKTTEHLDEISEEKLKSYVSVLRSRAKELEAEKFQLYRHPRFTVVNDYAFRPEKIAIKFLQKDEEKLREGSKILEDNFDFLRTAKSKKEISKFIEEMYTNLVLEPDQDDFGFPF